MNLAVRGNRVLVATVDQSETEVGSLTVVHAYAPDVMGTVIACGETHDVKNGDVVLFPPSAGQVVDYQGTNYLVLAEDELLAVVEDL